MQTNNYNFRLNAFATGNEVLKCHTCGKEYLGDKRSLACLQCDVEVVSSYIDDLVKDREKQKQKADRMTECLKNFKNFGDRHDAFPMMAHEWTYGKWIEWCSTIDFYVRDMVEKALNE